MFKIYLLEEDYDDQSIISVRKQDDLFQESTIIQQPSWIIKSMDESSSNSFVNHIPSIKLSPRLKIFSFLIKYSIIIF